MWRRLLAWAAAVGAGAYVAVIVAGPLLDRSLDVLRNHPEDYASGRYGVLVNLSYLGLALALAALAARLVIARGARAAAAALLVPAAVLCGALAVDPPTVARSGSWLSIAIVGLAAAPVALTTTLGPAFGARKNPSLALGLIVLGAFAGLVFAPESVSGLVNRVFDAAIGMWALLASLWISDRPDRVDR